MSELQFYEETHTYMLNGKVLPSVSELVRFKFNTPYKDIDPEILQRAAQYGTEVHELCEKLIDKSLYLWEIEASAIDEKQKEAAKNFLQLCKDWIFEFKDFEQPVHYKDKFAGTYDLRTTDDFLIDIKTTSQLHEDWLAVQLGLYYYAAGIKKDYGYVIWLPKFNDPMVKKIDVISFEECEELIADYEAHTKGVQLSLGGF